MLYRLPRTVPSVPILLADLGQPTAAELAAALDVSERTVWRWQAGAWPRAPHLALFFASTWGWSAVDADAHRSVAVWRDLAEARGRELTDLRGLVRRLAALNHGSANAPTMRA